MEREHFYERVVGELLEQGLVRREMRVLVVAGGELDRRVFAAHGFGDVTFSNLSSQDAADFEDAEALSYPDGSFDLAVISAALHHCRSPHHALLELHRVARVGLVALEARDSALMRLAIRLRDRYARLVEAPRFAWAFGGVFAVWAVISSVTIVVLVLAVGSGNHLSFIDLASLASSAVSGVLVILGVNQLRRDERLAAYLFFERALLVEIFVGEFFSFIHQQFGAVFGLALNILLLVTVKYMIRGEHDLERLGAAH